MKITYRRLIQFDQAASQYLANNKNTKLAYALERINKQLKVLVERFQTELREEVEDLQLEYALTDPPNSATGKVVKNDKGQYEYTKDDEGRLKNAIRGVQKRRIDEDEYDLNAYFATKIPDNLSDEALEAFSGVVIQSDVVDSILKNREMIAEPEDANEVNE